MTDLINIGVKTCPDCGKLMSIDNAICYGCGFDGDDLIINKYQEKYLNDKYQTNRVLSEAPFLAATTHGIKGKYGSVGTYHILKGSTTLCSMIDNSGVKLEVIGSMNQENTKLFYQSGCIKCQNAYKTDEA